jgi:uncharacterized protein YlxW (UPF0749 family)
MNVFTPRSRHQPWVWQVTGLCFILGLLLAGSLQTVRNINRSGGASTGRVGFPIRQPTASDVKETKKLQDEIAKVREEKTKLEETLAKGDGLAKTLNEELQKTKLLAGLTEVRGPGIVMILEDSKKGPPSNRQFEKPNYIIHDYTLQQAINELNASGAEAISINGQRIISRTPVRCVGPTAIVNDVRTASPFEIKAIGNPDTLWGGLNLPDGYVDTMFRTYDPDMCHMEKRKALVIDAYTGSTEIRYAKAADKTDHTERAQKADKKDDAAEGGTGAARNQSGQTSADMRSQSQVATARGAARHDH